MALILQCIDLIYKTMNGFYVEPTHNFLEIGFHKSESLTNPPPHKFCKFILVSINFRIEEETHNC